MPIPPAAKRPLADPKQLRRLHLAQLRPLRAAQDILKTHPTYPLVNACPVHPNPLPGGHMTGHFTSYKTRTNHELLRGCETGLRWGMLGLRDTDIPGLAGCSWPTLIGGLWHVWGLG